MQVKLFYIYILPSGRELVPGNLNTWDPTVGVGSYDQLSSVSFHRQVSLELSEVPGTRLHDTCTCDILIGIHRDTGYSLDTTHKFAYMYIIHVHVPHVHVVSLIFAFNFCPS